MRSNRMLCVILALAATAYAEDPKPYRTGTLQQMNSVPCSTAPKNSQGVAGQAPGDGSGGRQQTFCQEYVLQSDRVTYRIRPRDEKHSVLLPVGEPVRFRLQKEKIVLRVEDPEGTESRGKERAYVVVSMSPSSGGSTADAAPVRLNHLQ